jgi:AraC-like DNA-binding protein
MTKRLEAPTIPVRFARETLSRLRLSPRVRAQICREGAIPPALLRRRGVRLTRGQFERFYRAAVRAGRDEWLGYHARPVPLGTYASFVRASTRCADLESSAAIGGDLYGLFEPGGIWTLETSGDVAHLRARTRTAAQAGSILYVHSVLLVPWRAFSWLVGGGLTILGVTLPERFRELAPETRYLFGRAPDFGDVAEIRLPATQRKLPIVRRPEDLGSFLPGSFRSLLLGAPGDPIEERVRKLLHEWQPFAAASVDEIAARMETSRQTLARHLAKIGSSFAVLRDEIRRDYAVALLARGHRVAEVADALGYSEPSAFVRAFKSWTGASPGHYLA